MARTSSKKQIAACKDDQSRVPSGNRECKSMKMTLVMPERDTENNNNHNKNNQQQLQRKDHSNHNNNNNNNCHNNGYTIIILGKWKNCTIDLLSIKVFQRTVG